jgi:hypothetical protein
MNYLGARTLKIIPATLAAVSARRVPHYGQRQERESNHHNLRRESCVLSPSWTKWAIFRLSSFAAHNTARRIVLQ